MIILFLDDQNIRHELAEKYLTKAGHVVLHAFNADEANEILMSCKSRIGLALLDHDLNDIVEEDGRKFERHGVYFLAKMFADVPEERWPAQFIVHSYNADGVKNMLSDLRAKDQICSSMSFSGDMLKQIVEQIRMQ